MKMTTNSALSSSLQFDECQEKLKLKVCKHFELNKT